MSQGQLPTCDLLLTGGTVLTVDDERRVLAPGTVAVEGDRIVGVGHADELAGYRAQRTIDCGGCAVIPGFVDCHNHLFQGLVRGLGEGMSLWPWLSEFMWPFAAAVGHRDAVAAARLGAVEAARAGVTAVLDNHYAPADFEGTLGVASAIDEVGLRGVVARGIFGSYNDVAQKAGLAESLFRFTDDEEIEVTRSCISARPPGGKVAIWPAPINVIYNGQDIVRRSVSLAHELGAGWHTHCSESQTDPQIYHAAHGTRPVDWLYKEGLLGPRATIAHAIWLDDQEIEQLGETGSCVSYNPTSNQYLASGVLRLRELRSAGAVVGLGTDGPGCGHRQDMFEEAKQAVLLQRVQTLDPTASTAEEVFELATREGARLLGIDAGIIAPGRLADIAVVDLSRPHLAPLHRAVATLVYSAHASDVVMTIVGGEVIYENGRCTRVDEAEVMTEVQARADELIHRAGLERLRTPWRRTDGQDSSGG